MFAYNKSLRLLYIITMLAFEHIQSYPISGTSDEEPAELQTDDVVPYPENNNTLAARNFFMNYEGLWPKSTNEAGETIVIVPYVNDHMDPDVLAVMKRYMDEFREKSCIRWVERTTEEPYVHLKGVLPAGSKSNPNWCWATMGFTIYYEIYIYMGRGCVGIDRPGYETPSNAVHEMMHTLNFIHEHQRSDRDCYIDVSRETEKWVTNNQASLIADESFPYDERSVMQYSPDRTGLKMNAWSGGTLGADPDGGLSDNDWIRLNWLYCGGPHICELQPEACEKHRATLAQCYESGQWKVQYRPYD